MMKTTCVMSNLGAMVLGLVGSACAEVKMEDAHFRSWDEVPKMIKKIDGKLEWNHFKKMSELTRVSLGTDYGFNFGKDEKIQHLKELKVKWEKWWEDTGVKVEELKKKEAKVDTEAFELAWRFIGLADEHKPKVIQPVWIPKAWEFSMTFHTGDYFATVDEVWSMKRNADSVLLTKMSREGAGDVQLLQYRGLTPELADRYLRAVCYANLYAPPAGSKPPLNKLADLYYPHTSIRLEGEKGGVIWNEHGYDFLKSKAEHGGGAPGRSYYYLKTAFKGTEKWKNVLKPSLEQIQPYRKLLEKRKPYFFNYGRYIISYMKMHGDLTDLESILEWAEKLKVTADPKVSWRHCCGEFNSAMRVNVVNFTRTDLQETVKVAIELRLRLEKKYIGHGKTTLGRLSQAERRENALEEYVKIMLELETKEKEAEIMGFPLPLRKLIRVDRAENDPDLKQLKHAVQQIRSAPDPKLFKQIAAVMHKDSVGMGSLLEHIMLDKGGLLDHKPWGEKQKAIAVEACIVSLTKAKEEGRDKILETLLCAFGGGKIEVKGISIEVIVTKDGRSTIHDSSSNPMSLKDAQNELRRLFRKSVLDGN